uniref:Riboflavin biosynthesis protein n=1 Tax=Myxococcus xanthus TaxID=34 RepID=O30894_MYXXA|nr:hypothetical protein [Myxococcus xanthus DK 1622]
MKVYPAVADAGRALAGQALALGNFDGVHVGHQASSRRRAATGGPPPSPSIPIQARCSSRSWRRSSSPCCRASWSCSRSSGWTPRWCNPSRANTRARRPRTSRQRSSTRSASRTSWWAATSPTARPGAAPRRLREAAARRGATVHVVPPVTVDGVVASSSRVREYILEGRVSAARRLLGRPFDLDGTVVTGAGRGRGIGFPTANVDTQNELRPAPGVYAIRVQLPGESKGTWHGGAANIGVKPTFGGTEVTIEAHLLDFTGDLYGKELRVQFLDRLRPEQRFGSVVELTGQIKRDVEAARAVIAREES